MKRAILHLPDIADLTPITSLKTSAPGPAKPQAIPKKQAIADIEAARETLQELVGASNKNAAASVLAELKSLADDPLSAGGVSRENFYKIGIALVEEESCPFANKMGHGNATSQSPMQARSPQGIVAEAQGGEKKILPLTAILRKAQGILNPLLRHAAVAKPAIEMRWRVLFQVASHQAEL